MNAGYDNMEVNLDPVMDYIKAQNYKALEHEQNAKRLAGMDKWEVRQLTLLAALGGAGASFDNHTNLQALHAAMSRFPLMSSAFDVSVTSLCTQTVVLS